MRKRGGEEEETGRCKTNSLVDMTFVVEYFLIYPYLSSLHSSGRTDSLLFFLSSNNFSILVDCHETCERGKAETG
jgi:hypothetical protein